MPGLALVTGACSGIGLEIARELARRGHPLVMVSQRDQELVEAAARVAAEHQVDALPITLDLARPEAAQQLYDAVRARGLEVEILVNNAGIFFFGELADADPARANALLQLHVVMPTLLTQLFVREMRERRRGHVLIVSSISAWNDFPGIAIYGSSKRYLRSFAAALRSELRVWGVNVTCLAPGATATALYSQTGVPVQLAVKYGVMVDAAMVARRGVDGLFAGRGVVIPGLSAKLSAWSMALLPQWLIAVLRTHAPFLPGPPR
jgi:short-subunit dehydrogenase